MTDFHYKNEKTRAISFPLGGIGSGSIGLAGNGRLIDWEIFNRPNKNSVNGFSHMAVKAERGGEVLDARVLQGDLDPPYTGQGLVSFRGFGFGPERETLAGVPHFAEHEFIGEFPIASIKFRDAHFPGEVTLTAFNPFIPLNDEDSSIPAAFFEIEIRNTTADTTDYTANFAVANPAKDEQRLNEYFSDDGMHFMSFGTTKHQEDDLEYGTITLATDAQSISRQDYWYRGLWFDMLETYWRQFTTPGAWANRSYNPLTSRQVSTFGDHDHASLAVHFRLGPGEVHSARFVLTWNYPNVTNYWNPVRSEEIEAGLQGRWKNYYARLFRNSRESARYALKHWSRLWRDTLLFKETLFQSTLPGPVLDAVSANISVLKTPTAIRLENGEFYGWEGCHATEGSCEGSCTHVWNYAYAMPFLFPALERSMRDLDFTYNQREDGRMTFRLQLPLGRTSTFRACADGQFGGVIKAYREWKISGDSDWLRGHWPAIERSIEFAWAPTNEDRWDANRDGVLEGRQHHTLDMELFGPNAWLNGFYLAALKAGAEMADALGYTETAAGYRELFERGKRWTDDNLFNGEYYHQVIDLSDCSILEQYDESALSLYWNDEARQIKYQIADGCGIDQVVAQWHANLCGLGEIFDRGQTVRALHSIYRYNFKPRMRDVFNPCRLFSLNDEAGVVICEWPETTDKPMIPLTYAQETMDGFEYQVAAHMIQEGLLDEGLEIVSAIRHRYDGERRNPWNEIECGSNYARSMASYALLLAYSGFRFDANRKFIGFHPVEGSSQTFRCFWSLNSGWGEFVSSANRCTLTVLYGALDVQELALPLEDIPDTAVSLNGRTIGHDAKSGLLTFKEPIRLEKGGKLVVERAGSSDTGASAD